MMDREYMRIYMQKHKKPGRLEENKEDQMRIKEICEKAGVEFSRLEALGFMRAPCSKGHHLNRAGGLAEHSKNVVEWILKLSPAFGATWDDPRSPYVVGLLHDFVKLYNYDFDGEGRIKYRQAPVFGHGAASAILVQAELGIALTRQEALAITWHMGAFNLAGDDLKAYDVALDMEPRAILVTHTADMMAARVTECDRRPA